MTDRASPLFVAGDTRKTRFRQWEGAMQREEWKAPSFWPAGASCGEKAKARLARKRVQLN